MGTLQSMAVDEGLWPTRVQEDDASDLYGGGAATDTDLVGKGSDVHRHDQGIAETRQGPCSGSMGGCRPG